MKNLKKFASLLLALVMVLAMPAAAFAAEDDTGDITIHASQTSNPVGVAGKTFKAYKILDLQMVGANGYVYTVPEDLKSFYATTLEIDLDEGDFDYQVTRKITAMTEAELFAFAADALAAAKAAGIQPATATGAAGAEEVTIGNIPFGYYVVEDAGAEKPISALMLDTVNKAIDIYLKADKPTVDKKIDGDNDTDEGTTGKVENNNAAIGDNVPYEVTSKVPDMTGYTKYYFVLNDTLSKGLTFNDDVAITIGGTALTKDIDFTVEKTTNEDGTTSVEIVFKNFIQYKEQKGADIVVTYSATINGNAVIGTEGNANEVKLTYSNNPNTDESGNPGDKPGPDSPTGETPESKTRTFVTGVELIKVDPNNKRLTGAEFKIEGTKTNIVLVSKESFEENVDGTYWKLKDGSYTTDDPSSEGMDQSKYESTTVKYTKNVTTTQVETSEEVKATGTVGEDGVLRFDGLSAGTYTITELKAPNGYNLLQGPITVTIGFTAPNDQNSGCTWTVTAPADAQVVDGRVQLEVENQAGGLLPSTGGIGTTIFYIVGGILVVGAAVLLITKKRMSVNAKNVK